MARAVAVLGESADLPAVAELAELTEQQVADASGSARAGGDPGSGLAARIRAPAGARGRLPGALGRAARADARARRHRAARRRRAARSGGLAPALDGAALRRNGSWTCWWRRLRSAVRRSAPDSAVAYLTRALEEPPAPERRGRSCSISASPARTPTPRWRSSTCARPTSCSRIPRKRAIAAWLLSRTLIFAGSPETRRRSPSGRSPSFRRSSHDERNALEAVELISVYFGADVEGAHRAARSSCAIEPFGDGPGAKMLAGDRGVRVDGRRRATPTRASELALNAMEGGTLLEADNGLFWMGAMLTLVVADRPEAVPLWERDDGPGAPQRLAVLAALGDPLGRLPEARARVSWPRRRSRS